MPAPSHVPSRVTLPSPSTDTAVRSIGLAIVAGIAALHGGTAAVGRSPELGGARFTIECPPA